LWHAFAETSIFLSEALFNFCMLFPCAQTLRRLITNPEYGGVHFISGEVLLDSTHKIVKGEAFKVDELIRTAEPKLELAILETSGAFANPDRTSSLLITSKLTCCIKEMLSALASKFKHGSQALLAKVPVFFLHARGKLRWQIFT
jgi:hypothetical protein